MTAPKNGEPMMVTHGWRRDLKDVGDQALMRGLATAFPIVRPRHYLSYSERRREAGHKASDGSSPAAIPPLPFREEAMPLHSGCLRLPGHGPVIRARP